MSNPKPTFLGSVLKAIACTPNRGDDAAAYDRDVIEPSRAFRARWEALGEERPPDDEIRAVLGQLATAFETKRVDPQEQRQRLDEIARLHGLEDLVKDITLTPRSAQ